MLCLPGVTPAPKGTTLEGGARVPTPPEDGSLSGAYNPKHADRPVVTAKTLRPEDHVKETDNDKEKWEDTIRLDHVETYTLREAILAMI